MRTRIPLHVEVEIYSWLVLPAETVARPVADAATSIALVVANLDDVATSVAIVVAGV